MGYTKANKNKRQELMYEEVNQAKPWGCIYIYIYTSNSIEKISIFTYALLSMYERDG